MTTYEMTTIDNGTRIRDLPNTGGKELTRVNANVKVTGSELFTAPAQLVNADGVVYQYVGDKWLKITYNGVTGWMAYIHKGTPICNNFKEVVVTPPTDPQPVAGFPDSFIQTNNDPKHPDYGKQAEYVFVRVLP